MTRNPAAEPYDPAGLEAVLFDLDGTLVDSEGVWEITLDETAAWLGGALSDAARLAMVGASLPMSVAILHADLGVVGDARATGDYLLARTRERFARGLACRPGALDLLAAVRAAGVPTALVTSTQRGLVDLALPAVAPHVFDAVVCGDEVRHPKPDPEPYLTAARLLGAAPERCLAVEDSPTGLAAAEAAGCPVLVVPNLVPVGPAPGRTVRPTLVGLTVADLAEFVPATRARAS